MKLSVIIPARNEEESLELVVAGLVNELLKENIENEIILIDDNSFDRTGEIVEFLTKEYSNVRAMHRGAPPGFGLALKEGFAGASGEVIVPVMADCSDGPKDVVKLFRKVEEGYDVVYGSRFTKGGKAYDYPLIKLIINRVANNFIRMIFRMEGNDITNALKAYRREVLEEISPIESTEFNITLELPLKAYLKGFKHTSIPVNWYGRKSGISKFTAIDLVGFYRHYLLILFKVFKIWIREGFTKR